MKIEVKGDTDKSDDDSKPNQIKQNCWWLTGGSDAPVDGWLEEGLVVASCCSCCQEITMVILEIKGHQCAEFCVNWCWNRGTGELMVDDL